MNEEPPGETLVVDNDPWAREAKTLLGLYDTPAYLRRGLRVEQAWRELDNTCSRQREAWLDSVRMRLRCWLRWTRAGLPPSFPETEAQRAWVARLAAQCGIDLAFSDRQPAAGSPIRAWEDLVASVERFNHRWLEFVMTRDLEGLNHLIESYNRHYLFEKECAWASPRLARRGFQPLTRATAPALLERYRLLESYEAEAGTGPASLPR